MDTIEEIIPDYIRIKNWIHMTSFREVLRILILEKKHGRFDDAKKIIRSFTIFFYFSG